MLVIVAFQSESNDALRPRTTSVGRKKLDENATRREEGKKKRDKEEEEERA